MASNVDITQPPEGSATIAGVRNNFVAMKQEIEELQAYSPGGGQPVFIAPTLLNNWVNYGGSDTPAGYRKLFCGLVEIRGRVKDGTINQPLFVLPDGFRPAATLAIMIKNSGSVGQLNIEADGTVRIVSGNNVWVTLGALLFHPEPAA